MWTVTVCHMVYFSSLARCTVAPVTMCTVALVTRCTVAPLTRCTVAPFTRCTESPVMVWFRRRPSLGANGAACTRLDGDECRGVVDGVACTRLDGDECRGVVDGVASDATGIPVSLL